MEIGVLIHFDHVDTIRQRIDSVAQLGFKTFQLGSWVPQLWTAENAQMVKNAAAERGLTINSFWCGWGGPKVWDFYDGQLTLGLVPPEYRQMRVDELCRGGDFAALLGITDVVTHMGFIPENPYDPQFAPLCVAVRTVARHLKKNGQNLLFETGQETPVTMLRCFEKVGEDNLYVNLDTANLILYGKANPVDALDVFGKYVRNIHAKDGLYPTNGHDLGKEVRIGEGKVDFRALFARLRQLGYDRWVTIEREIEGEQQRLDILHAKTYLEELIGQIYGG